MFRTRAMSFNDAEAHASEEPRCRSTPCSRDPRASMMPRLTPRKNPAARVIAFPRHQRFNDAEAHASEEPYTLTKGQAAALIASMMPRLTPRKNRQYCSG